MASSDIANVHSALRLGATGSTQWFPDPFLDYSGIYTPSNLRAMLKWSELMWSSNGTYRMALQRVVAYFLTQVELIDVTDNVKKRYEEFLNDTLKVMSELRLIGLDFIMYGNSFSSVIMPFRRYLRCNNCKFEQPIKRVPYVFRNFKYYSSCIKCNCRGEHEAFDRRSTEQDKIRIKRWSPHDIELLYHPISHSCEYLYRIPEDLKRMVRQGKSFYLEHTPLKMIEAIEKDGMFKFDDERVFHFKEDTLAGLNNRGWGIPLALSNFKQGFYVQTLKRYNEAIALDYVVPWRIITPGRPSGPTGQVDPALHANLGGFSQTIRGMIAEHRRDPLAMHSLPFPVEYQTLGGEANSLAPSELLSLGIDELLNSCGVPAELYKGTLSMQAMPSALRLFEATWPHLVAGFNNWLNWMLDQVATSLSWESARARLTPVTRADDMEARVMRLQLSAAQKISDSTALAPLGIDDIRSEIKKMFDEQRIYQEEAKKFEEEQAQAEEMQRRLAETAAMQQGMMPGGGAMPPGGMAPGGGMGGGMGAPGGGQGGSMTPGDILDQAEQIAGQLIEQPEAERRRQLSQIRQTDETLHAVVKQKLEQMRTEARSVGQQQVIQQAAGGM